MLIRFPFDWENTLEQALPSMWPYIIIDSTPYGHGIGNAVSFIVLSVYRSWFSPLRTCNSAMFFMNFTKLLLVNQYV